MYSFLKQVLLQMSVISVVVIGSSVQASIMTLEHTVEATDNLYAEDWGHWFTQESDHALLPYAPGSTQPFAVGSGFNFSGIGFIDIDVTGSIVGAGVFETGPDGCPAFDSSCAFSNGSYFYQPAYSVIGIWSSSAFGIDPILAANTYGDWRDAPFLVGSGLQLIIPDVDEAFLFLAVNDGIFADNEGAFNATINYAVPEPSSIVLLLSSMLGLAYTRRKKL
ncbi:MAG: hypothetical protein ACJA0N_002479 [Pseudohongiellaceae bacterium]